MSKNNRHGQAEILNDVELNRIYKQLVSDRHKLFFNIARYTGERFGAICQLKVCDVYICFSGIGDPLKEITFRAATRKASPDGSQKTRQAFICDRLAEYLMAYSPSSDRGWLFPNPFDKDKHITFSCADKWLRLAVEGAGLQSRGISTHTFRRTFINKLYHDGAMDVYAIQQIVGHSDIATTQRYLSADKPKLAIALNNVFS
jgi:integrase/recombinase XerD